MKSENGRRCGVFLHPGCQIRSFPLRVACCLLRSACSFHPIAARSSFPVVCGWCTLNQTKEEGALVARRLPSTHTSTLLPSVEVAECQLPSQTFLPSSSLLHRLTLISILSLFSSYKLTHQLNPRNYPITFNNPRHHGGHRGALGPHLEPASDVPYGPFHISGILELPFMEPSQTHPRTTRCRLEQVVDAT